MLTHGNVVAACRGAAGTFTFENHKISWFSFMPYAHCFERRVICSTLTTGGHISFSQGSTLKIGDDLRLVRPTLLAAVPALFDRIWDKIVAGAKAKGGLKAVAFSKALASKLKAIGEGKPLTTCTLSRTDSFSSP